MEIGDRGRELDELASRKGRALPRELLAWVVHARKWWLLPLLLLLLLAGLFAFVSGSSLAPFIYALF